VHTQYEAEALHFSDLLENQGWAELVPQNQAQSSASPVSRRDSAGTTLDFPRGPREAISRLPPAPIAQRRALNEKN
jgi:hypothetical protein